MSMTEGTTLTSNRASSSDICVFVYVQLLLFRIVPEMSERDFFICQPGSPVATSLCEGEALLRWWQCSPLGELLIAQGMALLTLSGNPVATSLCEGEALPKMVAVLTIRCELMIAQGMALLSLSAILWPPPSVRVRLS